MKLFTWITMLVLGIAVGMLFSSAQAWEDAPTALLGVVDAKDSPKDRIPEKAIGVYRDRVILDIQHAQWATFTDTHSMEPVIMAGANAIELVPKSADDIQVGDIVSYKSEYADGNIIHRVVYKGQDEKGIYFIMKGDNLPTSDPGRVRFEQMQRVVVAIVY